MVSEGNRQALMCQADNTALQGKSSWEAEDERLAAIKGMSPCQPLPYMVGLRNNEDKTPQSPEGCPQELSMVSTRATPPLYSSDFLAV